MKKIHYMASVVLSLFILTSCHQKPAVQQHDTRTKLQILTDLALADMMFIPGGEYQMGPSDPHFQTALLHKSKVEKAAALFSGL